MNCETKMRTLHVADRFFRAAPPHPQFNVDRETLMPVAKFMSFKRTPRGYTLALPATLNWGSGGQTCQCKQEMALSFHLRNCFRQQSQKHIRYSQDKNMSHNSHVEW